MRVYNSPAQLKPSNMQKKSSINFVKNVAAPKQPKNQPSFPTSHNNFPNNNSNHNNNHNTTTNNKLLHTFHLKYTPKQSPALLLTIHLPLTSTNKPPLTEPPIHVHFPYNSQTQIRQLIAFIHTQVQNNMVYVKSQNVYVDYILGLKAFRVGKMVDIIKREEQVEGKANALEVQCCEYGEVERDNYLRNFEIIKCVGSGGFSKVFLVRGFGRLMAMKVINKQYILSNDKSNIINNEKTILSICSEHPFITKLEASFETNSYLMFVMEFCNGGQLFNLLRKVRRMKEHDAQFYFVETLCAIVYLHRKGIVYRDIKPENIIIDYEGHVRLADYGLSKLMEQTREAKTYSFCGSAEYMAPQMLLKKGHSYQIDFYCLGALLYQLVIGLPPYYSRNQTELFSNIIHNDLQFPAHVELSNQLKQFLTRLLQKEVEHRYQTIQQILDDPWMKNIDLEIVMDKRLKPPYETDMFAYNFDDADFAQEQGEMMQNLRQEQRLHVFDNMRFPDFFYESKETSDLKSIISNSKHQDMFIRSMNCGEFIAEKTYMTGHKQQAGQSRRGSNASSMIMMTQHSREPSINRLQQLNIMSIPTSSQITRRGDISNVFTTGERINSQTDSHQKMNYLPSTLSPKNHLSSVRSLQHLHITTKLHRYPQNNRSHQRISSITKKPSNYHPIPYNNIYTSHKHPFQGLKLTQHNSNSFSTSHIRSPNYYSVQKSSSRGSGIRMDIIDLRIKNQRGFSVERPSENFSVNLTIGGGGGQVRENGGYLKHAVSAYEMKRSYIDGLREKNLSKKVKKSSFKNGEKISVSMLNNLHYRN